METHVSDKYRDDGHYHDASEHGFFWAVLNEMLHVIVFVYTLYGMIQFRVKFIRAQQLVRWLSYLLVAHNWYLMIKFGAIAIVMYLFNERLESMDQVSLSDYNCSLANHPLVVERSSETIGATKLPALKSENASQAEPRAPREPGEEQRRLAGLWLPEQCSLLIEQLAELNYMLLYAKLLETFGGPFKLLGNRATLHHGMYATGYMIMLTIFPIELMYNHVGFNFIRFVLSDPSCMRELYRNRNRHLDRLSAWSRNQTNSELTLGTKMTLNQRDLRSRFADDCNRLAVQLVMANMEASHFGVSGHARDSFDSDKSVPSSPASSDPHTVAECRCRNFRHLARQQGEQANRPTCVWWRTKTSSNRFSKVNKSSYNKLTNWSNGHVSKVATAEYKLTSGVKPLRSRLAINHYDSPSYQVRVANKNLNRFKPFVRSEYWFKSSMIVYPIFIVYYFSLLIGLMTLIAIYFDSTLQEVNETCRREVDPSINLWDNWTFLDELIYFELQYSAFALSCASSFYCSYYFGTILELYIWMLELEQQLVLCRILIEISEHSQQRIGIFASLLHTSTEQTTSLDSLRARTALQLFKPCYCYNCLNDENNQTKIGSKRCSNDNGPHLKQSNNQYQQEKNHADRERQARREHELDQMVDECFNDFGGIKSFWTNYKVAQCSSQMGRFKISELIAIKLMQKKQTLLRATYINTNLFLDELNETRFMNNTILRRTTLLGLGCATIASLTRSQFKANYWHLTFLLAVCLAILNLYLACAATINSNVNKLLVRVHSLISASLRTCSEDADLFEFWVRHIRSFGEDRDVMSYKIYGYKITWASIMNFDSVMCTAYFYTIY